MKLDALLLSLFVMMPLAAIELAAEAPTASSHASEINWLTNFDQAKKLAAEQKKPLFLYFTGSDWCPWCKKMDSEILTTAPFQNALVNKLIFVKVDFPRKELLDENLTKQNDKLATDYNVQGFPTVVLVDSNLKEIDKLHYEGDEAAAFANKVLKAIETATERSPRKT